MADRYVLFLVSLNPDRTDSSGFKYPKSGYVESKNYKDDSNILNGLYGTLWGKTNSPLWLNTDPDAQWCVVKCEQNDEIISLDAENSFYKFRSGMVVYDGCRADCYKYIDSNCPKELQGQNAGTEIISTAEDYSILVKGYESKAITEKTNSHAINVGTKGIARACGYESHSVALGKDGEAVATGENGNAFAVSDNTTATAKGYNTTAIALGRHSIAVAGENGIAMAIGTCGEAQVGENGIIVLGYLDNDLKFRLKIGYVGEDGIEPNTSYKIGDMEEFCKLPLQESNS